MPTTQLAFCGFQLSSPARSDSRQERVTDAGKHPRGNHPDEVTQTLRGLFEVTVIANVHIINLFMPLIFKGRAKKVIMISSGFGCTQWAMKPTDHNLRCTMLVYLHKA
jgi:hypothetical protein